MKYLKILGLGAIAAVVLAALGGAGSASATALYNTSTKLGVGSELDFSLKPGTNVKWTETSGPVIDECSASTIKASITNAGGVGVDVQTKITSLTWGSCTFATATNVNGGLSIAQIGTSTEGTVKANAEIVVSINTIIWGICTYGISNGTHFGVLRTFASTTAELTLNSVATKRSGSNFTCPETVKWVATYVGTSPDELRVEAS